MLEEIELTGRNQLFWRDSLFSHERLLSVSINLDIQRTSIHEFSSLILLWLNYFDVVPCGFGYERRCDLKAERL